MLFNEFVVKQLETAQRQFMRYPGATQYTALQDAMIVYQFLHTRAARVINPMLTGAHGADFVTMLERGKAEAMLL